MNPTAVGTGDGKVVLDSHGGEGEEDAADGVGVVIGVIEGIVVDVEHGVLGHFAEPYAVEACALFDESIAKGMAGFGLPFGLEAMTFMDEIPPMREDRHKWICLWDGAKISLRVYTTPVKVNISTVIGVG